MLHAAGILASDVDVMKTKILHVCRLAGNLGDYVRIQKNTRLSRVDRS